MTIELSAELVGLAVANMATVIGFFTKLSSRLTKVEAQQEFLVAAFKDQYGINTGDYPKVRKK